MTKTNTKDKAHAWALKSKDTGIIYGAYPTRAAARKAAKGRRFKGNYTPIKAKAQKALVQRARAQVPQSTAQTLTQSIAVARSPDVRSRLSRSSTKMVYAPNKLIKTNKGTPTHAMTPIYQGWR